MLLNSIAIASTLLVGMTGIFSHRLCLPQYLKKIVERVKRLSGF